MKVAMIVLLVFVSIMTMDVVMIKEQNQLTLNRITDIGLDITDIKDHIIGKEITDFGKAETSMLIVPVGAVHTEDDLWAIVHDYDENTRMEFFTENGARFAVEVSGISFAKNQPDAYRRLYHISGETSDLLAFADKVPIDTPVSAKTHVIIVDFDPITGESQDMVVNAVINEADQYAVDLPGNQGPFAAPRR